MPLNTNKYSSYVSYYHLNTLTQVMRSSLEFGILECKKSSHLCYVNFTEI